MSDVVPVWYPLKVILMAALGFLLLFLPGFHLARTEHDVWDRRHYEVGPHPEISLASPYGQHRYALPLPYHVVGTPTQLFAFKLGMTFVLLMPFLLGAAVGFLCLTTTRASSSQRKSRRKRRRKMMRTVDAAALLID